MNSLVQNVVRVFRPITTTDHRQRRLLSIVQGAVTNLSGRLLGLAITFFSVPLTIGYLGRERYGAWVTIGSFMAWAALTDLGFGNGLTNAVTTAAGQDRPDLVRMHLSNGVLIMSAIAATALLLLTLAWPHVGWADALGVSGAEARSEVNGAVAAALGIFLLSMPLSVVNKVYPAYQLGRISNYWAMTGNVLSFLALLVVTRTQGGLVWLVIAISGAPLAMTIAQNLHIFFRHRPELRPHWRHADLPAMRSLSKVGGSFFLIQIMALVTFQTDNIVISHFLGAGRVPEYSLTYSLFSYSSIPLTTVFYYIWPAYTEAIARKDIAWVRKAFRLHVLAGTGYSVLSAAVLVVIARPFIAMWAGDAVVPSTPLVWWMMAWAVINGFTNPLACLLAAASHLKMQTVFSALSTVANLVLSVLLVQQVGVTGVIAATVIAYAVFVCGPVYVVCQRLLESLAHEV